MRIFSWTLALSVTALMLVGCTNTAGEVCGTGAFGFSGAAGSFSREVCFHSLQTIDCDIYNYRIPPKEDFSDYIDIFWDPDPGCETNDFDGSFEHEFTDSTGAIRTTRFNLSGTSPGMPPQAPGLQLLGSGSYNTTDGEQGTFELFW